MEDNEEYKGQFANDFMIFAMELNMTLKRNGIVEIKF